MPSEVILPRVDMDMTTGKIAKWFVEAGATVAKGQPLFEIETDKAAMEIEAPVSGTIRDMAEASGADIPVGSVVAWIFAEGEQPVAAYKLATQAEKSKGEAARLSVEDHRFDSALPAPLHHASGPESPDETTEAPAARPRATPMARRLARAQGVDLAALKGSGPRGRIQAADIAPVSAANPAAASRAPSDTVASLAAPEPLISPAVSPAARAAPQGAASRAAGPLNLLHLREGEGRPTLMIHGFGADANTWRPFLAGAASRRPMLALDLPGHGGSPLGAVTDFASLVDAAEAALAASGLGAVDLVGHSLGAAVAAALAARGGLDVRSLLLLSPAGLGPDINGAFMQGFLGAGAETSLTPWMHELVADPAFITPAFVRATLKAREGTDLVAAQRRVAGAVFPDATQAFSIRPDLARLAMPTRVVFGAADRIIPARHAGSLPGPIALHLFPGIGHMPQFEARDAVAAIQAQMQAAA